MASDSWRIYTDGSCINGLPENSRSRGWGGWAAVIEHGHDGMVARGREADTTNVRMELRAVIEGLRRVPRGEGVPVIHTDCTCIVVVSSRWRIGHRSCEGKDIDLWRELWVEFDRHPEFRINLLTKNNRDSIHRRAHGIAQAEARAGHKGLDADSIPVPVSARSEKRRRRQMRRLQHLRGCGVDFCMYDCPVWLARNKQARWTMGMS